MKLKKSNQIFLDTVNSTNDFAIKFLKGKKCNLKENYDNLLIYTDNQNQGRGQRGNFWESERKKNLTFSVVWFPEFLKANEQFYLLKSVAMAIIDFLFPLIKDELKIKWSNDIYVKDKKIAGILIENVIKGEFIKQSVIGIGININQIKFFYPNTISLKEILNKDFSLERLLKKVLNHLKFRYEELEKKNFLSLSEEYLKFLYRFNKFYTYEVICKKNYFILAKIKDVENNGLLILEKKNGGILKFSFKELRFII